MKVYLFFFCLIVLGLMQACETEVSLNAPEKPIWTMFAVLDPDSSTQELRIARGFLTDGNVLDFAKANDLSVRGLRVTLSDGRQSWIAEEVDSILTDENGAFQPSIGIYRFRTGASQRLFSGRRYELRVADPNADTFFMRAAVTVPEPVRINSPRTTPGPGFTRCLQALALENAYRIEFSPSEQALGYEVRGQLLYQSRGGEMREASFGPTPVFTESLGCGVGNGFCYQWGAREIIEQLQIEMQTGGETAFQYGVNSTNRCGDFDELPQVFQFEVTALDTALTRYIEANSPRFLDLNTLRPEFTNIESSEIALGVVGAISSSRAAAGFSPCAEFFLGLNGTPAPVGCDL